MKHRTLKIAAASLLIMSCLILPVAAADMGNNTDPRAVQNFFYSAPRDGQSMPGSMGDSGSMGTSDGNGSNIDGSQNGQGNSGSTNGSGNSGNSGNTGGSGSMGGSGNSGSSGGMSDTTDGNLGDTSGPTESGDGVIEGTMDTNNSPMSDMGNSSGDTAGGTNDTSDTGGSMLGIIITLLLIGAVVILIFALIPKRKS